MSNVQKGRRSVAKAKKHYESLGFIWDTCEKPRNIKAGGSRDLFGMFDAVILHENMVPCFVQVKTNNATDVKKYKDFAAKYTMCIDLFTYHVKTGERKGIRIHHIEPNETNIEDLRGPKPKNKNKK